MKSLVPLTHIEHRIYLIRSCKVMLDEDLAKIYGVSTKRLNQQARRNQKRFPQDFMFQLTKEEADSLRLQNATLEAGRGKYRKYPPCVFTEHGAVMLASVLHTEIAIEASVQIARAFVRLREMIVSNKDLSRHLNELEKKYDAQFREVFDAIRGLMNPPAKPNRPIGFNPGG